MDQVRTIAKQAREHWFWIACGSIFFIGLVTWFMITMGLADQTNTWRTEIEQRFSTAQQVLATGVMPEGRTQKFHPNAITHEKMDEQNATLKKSVLLAWEEQHSSQGERALAWPADLNPAVRKRVAEITTRDDGHGGVVRLAVEEAVPFPPEDSVLTISLRTIYGSYIRDELPKLAQTIGSNWGSTDPKGEKPIVYWDPSNQTHIATTRFDWSGQDRLAPNALQVFYAQEDLRVLEALMDIIAETNRDATADYNAVIKRIESIQLGRDASLRAGSIKRVGGGNNASVNGEGQEGGDSAFGAADEGGGEPEEDLSGGGLDGDGEEGAAPTIDDPAHHRYVDLNYQPLSAQTLRESFTSKDPKIAKLAVAKRLPVRMRVVMDQRKINDLLTACGNSWLTVEVRQVRLNPQSDAGVATNNVPRGGGGFGGGGFDFGGGGDLDDGGGFNQAPAANAAASAVKDKNTQFDVTVELYGIVYIYNPVDAKKFGVPTEATAAGEAEAAPADQPVADAAPSET